MSRVGVEEAAPVGAQHFDCLLQSNRPLGNGLNAALKGVNQGVLVEIVGDALPDEKKSVDKRERNEYVEDAPHQVDPEVSDGVAGAASQTSDQSHSPNDAGSSRSEIVPRQSGHLGQVGHGGLATVVLPVGIRSETGRGVGCQPLRHIAEILRIEESAMPLLGSFQQVEGEESHDAEEE